MAPLSHTVRWTVPTPERFRFRTTVLSHGWLQLAPFGHDERFTTLTRVHRLSDGRVVELVMRAAEKDEALEVSVAGWEDEPAPALRHEVTRAVRRIFHLDLDLGPFYDLLREEEGYAWVEERGAGRLLRAPTVWEDLAKVLLTTNTTWASTRKMVERLCALGKPLPEDHGEGAGEHRHAFPTPEEVAALGPEELAGRVQAGYRVPSLHELAREIASGRLDPELWLDGDLPAGELYQRVTALRGFGPYAGGTVLKLLGRYDELALDSVTRGVFARRFNRGEPAPDADIRAHYDPYGRWRGLVVWVDALAESVDDFLRASGEEAP